MNGFGDQKIVKRNSTALNITAKQMSSFWYIYPNTFPEAQNLNSLFLRFASFPSFIQTFFFFFPAHRLYVSSKIYFCFPFPNYLFYDFLTLVHFLSLKREMVLTIFFLSNSHTQKTIVNKFQKKKCSLFSTFYFSSRTYCITSHKGT